MKKVTSSRKNILFTIFIMILWSSCSSQMTPQKSKQEWTEESIKKYLDENKGKLDPIEGIYSISQDNTDKSLMRFISPTKKSNDMARVAILKNNESFTPQFVELLLEGLNLPKYTQTAEFTRIQTSSTYLSKQFSSDGDFTTYTFAYDDDAGSMEGFKKNDQALKLLYLKLYPVK